VLAHLADVDRRRDRTRRMAQEDSPKLESYDQNAIYAAASIPEEAGASAAHLCTNADRTLSIAPLPFGWRAGRAGQHASIGRITLSDLLHEWAFHDLATSADLRAYRSRPFIRKWALSRRFTP